VAGAGVIATAALVLIFGNQIFTEWADRHAKADTVWGWFLHTLTWPRWSIDAGDSSNSALRQLVANDLRALFLILFVALVLGVAAKTVSGGAGGFILGWAALIFASALAAFVTAFIVSNPSMLSAFAAAAAGSAYGLFVGWIVGALTATAKSAG
jgi:hypothetical protein